MTRFWPNFKGRFLGPSLTDANYHSDISIFSYFFYPIIFVWNFFCIVRFLDQKLFYLNFFGQHFFVLKFFLDKKLFWIQNLFGSKKIWLRFFWPTFFNQKFLDLTNLTKILDLTNLTTTTILMGFDTTLINLVVIKETKTSDISLRIPGFQSFHFHGFFPSKVMRSDQEEHWQGFMFWMQTLTFP